MSDLERLAAILEPQAWAALGIGDTLAYQNRRTSSLRKARRFLVALMDPSEKMIEGGAKTLWLVGEYFDTKTAFNDLPEYGQEYWRDRASAAITGAISVILEDGK